MNDILDYLDKILPNAKCELNYNKDYELLIAVMLSAQTTDKRVNEVTKVLFDKYPNLEALNKAKIEDIENVIKTIGTYHKKAIYIKNIANKLINVGYVPNNRPFLETLDGVGRKTINVVLSVLYNEPFMAVDTHVNRVSKRLGLATKKDDVLKIEQKLYKVIPKDRISRAHHQLVLFGRYYCKASNPLCDTCELKNICKHKKS